MKKALFALLLATVFCFSAAGCSPKDRVGVDSSGLDPFVIGGIGPLTGEGAEYGTSVLQGAQLAVDEINATGGVNGFRLVLNFQDSKGDAQNAVSVYEKLKDNDMKILLGGVFTEETAALAQASAEDGVLIVAPTACGKDALGTGGNLFRVCLDSPRLGTTAANFILDNETVNTSAVLFSDDAFGGEEISAAFVSAFADRDVTTYRYSIASEEDLEQTILRLDRQKYDAVLLALSPELTERFLQKYEGSSRLFSVHPPKNAEENEGIAVISSFFPEEDNKLMKNFFSSYQDLYGQLPDRYAADAYDAVYAMAEAIKRAGIDPENVDYADTNDRLISAMTKIDVDGITGTVSWTADGENNRNASVRILKEGSYVPYPTKNQSDQPQTP